MGHHTTFQQDIKKGISQTRILIRVFNDLSNQKYDGRMLAVLKQSHRFDGSTVIMCDKNTGKFLIVDPKPRQMMKHHVSGHMIYCRDSKMTKQERIDWAINRVIWLAVMPDDDPISYSIITVRELHKLRLINFNFLPSNPTALRFSTNRHMPIIPWLGGTCGFGFVQYEDVVEAFIRIVNEKPDRDRHT